MGFSPFSTKVNVKKHNVRESGMLLTQALNPDTILPSPVCPQQSGNSCLLLA